ncbi:MAG: TIGR02206 family membrane protein [Phycisphaeraceae bacterium]|nr:TIGR02206 family membrane protein [Phycisphaeraceae bacterium]MCW5764285.1 TIGR02206 family membrane protein [Phycisphaeraceae bacterium]
MLSETIPLLAQMAWIDEIRPRTNAYRVLMVICAVVIAVAIVAGRRLADRPGQRVLEHAIGWSTIGVQLFALVWRNLPGNFDMQEALPLQLCRVVAWACAIAMITRARWALSLTFFWGLGLSSMGFITPVVRTGPVSVSFWLFWAAHVQIVGIALYQIIVHGYGPWPRDLRFAVIASVVYVAVVVPVNLMLNVDYGYLGASAYDRTTLAGRMGAFPLRAVKMVAMGMVWMLLLYLIARMVGTIKERRTAQVA